LAGAFADCPAGRRAVGGGILSTGSRQVFVAASGPLDGSGAGGPLDPSGSVESTRDGDVAKRWYAGLSNPSSANAGVKVLALCSAVSDATIRATPLSVGARKTGQAVATCPAGRRALGGGVVQEGWPDDRVLVSGPRDGSGTVAGTGDGDAARQWYAAVHNLPAHRVGFKVFVLCSADSRATVEATGFSVAGGRTGHASVKCPAGKRLLGGGLVQAGPARFLRELSSGPLAASGGAAGTRDGDVAKSWYALVENRNPGRVSFKVLAMCEPS
ncbi:MAG: hypothetical protein ACRDK1_09900, partial [Solirubrobacterales bacterium]